MARYFITGYFTYRTRTGEGRYTSPHGPAHVFDTEDPRIEVDATFVPPPVGLEPMDAEAKAAIDAVRGADTPIYNP